MTYSSSIGTSAKAGLGTRHAYLAHPCVVPLATGRVYATSAGTCDGRHELVRRELGLQKASLPRVETTTDPHILPRAPGGQSTGLNVPTTHYSKRSQAADSVCPTVYTRQCIHTLRGGSTRQWTLPGLPRSVCLLPPAPSIPAILHPVLPSFGPCAPDLAEPPLLLAMAVHVAGIDSNGVLHRCR